MSNIKQRLVDKSVEAFITGIELYNKPTIKYRIEGFSFFICNAWELMLKAKLVADGKSIYYKDSPNRSFDLSRLVHIIYTDKRQPLRINLEKIIELRNTSVHFITTEHEAVYAPLFQSAVINFTREVERFHGVDITSYIPQNFLTLSATMQELASHEIKMKYDAETAERLLLQKNDIEVTAATLDFSDKFAIQVKHSLFITRSKEKADFAIAIDNDSPNITSIIKEYKDPADTHKYSFTNLLDAIAKKIGRENIDFEYRNSAGMPKTLFTQNILSMFIDFYDMKNQIEYAYGHVVGNNTQYTYSQKALEFIVEEIRKAPKNIVGSLREAKNKITPGT